MKSKINIKGENYKLAEDSIKRSDSIASASIASGIAELKSGLANEYNSIIVDVIVAQETGVVNKYDSLFPLLPPLPLLPSEMGHLFP